MKAARNSSVNTPEHCLERGSKNTAVVFLRAGKTLQSGGGSGSRERGQDLHPGEMMTDFFGLLAEMMKGE